MSRRLRRRPDDPDSAADDGPARRARRPRRWDVAVGYETVRLAEEGSRLEAFANVALSLAASALGWHLATR